tara:strand:+ start:214 stop:477 length:264 start_codon:yes stop_codon:yes gene_type:complete
MKILSSLTAAIAIGASLIAAPAVQADSVWLIMKEAVRMSSSRFALDLEKLEMKDMEQCEEQGAVFISSERMGKDRGKDVGFECLEAK